MKIKRKSVIITIIMLIGIMVFSAFSLVVFNVLKSKKNEQYNLNVEAAYTFDDSNGRIEKTSDSRYSSNSVFYITTPTGLNEFSVSVAYGCDFSGKNVYLSNDINMAGYNWQPIGASMDGDVLHETSEYFKGNFNGQGYTVSNLSTTINDSPRGSRFYLGFFTKLYGDLTVQNLKIKNFTINLTEDHGYAHAGSIAGSTEEGSVQIKNCLIDNFKVNNVITGSYFGGVVGYIHSCETSIYNCAINNVTIDAAESSYVGGFVGKIYVYDSSQYGNPIEGKLTMNNCYIYNLSAKDATPIVFSPAGSVLGINSPYGGSTYDDQYYNYEITNCVARGCGTYALNKTNVGSLSACSNIMTNVHKTANTTSGLDVSSVGGTSGTSTWYYGANDYNGGYPYLRQFVPSWYKVYFLDKEFNRKVAREGNANGTIIDYIEIPTECSSSLPTGDPVSTTAIMTICNRIIYAPHSECCTTVSWRSLSNYFSGATTYQFALNYYSRTVTINLNNGENVSTINTLTVSCGLNLSLYYESFSKSGAFKSCNFNGGTYVYTPPTGYYISNVDFTSGTAIHADTTITITIARKTYSATFN